MHTHASTQTRRDSQLVHTHTLTHTHTLHSLHMHDSLSMKAHTTRIHNAQTVSGIGRCRDTAISLPSPALTLPWFASSHSRVPNLVANWLSFAEKYLLASNVQLCSSAPPPFSLIDVSGSHCDMLAVWSATVLPHAGMLVPQNLCFVSHEPLHTSACLNGETTGVPFQISASVTGMHAW